MRSGEGRALAEESASAMLLLAKLKHPGSNRNELAMIVEVRLLLQPQQYDSVVAVGVTVELPVDNEVGIMMVVS